MWLHVATTVLSSSSLLNTQRLELLFQRRLWDQINVSVFGVTKRMSGKILKTNKMCVALSSKFCSALLLVVFIKCVFYKDNKQQH